MIVRRLAIALALVVAALIGVILVNRDLATRLLRFVVVLPLPVPAGHQVTFSGRAVVPTISPDGKTVAYILNQLGTPVAAPSGDQRVMVQDIESGNAVEIFRGTAIQTLRWSPDGAYLACCGITSDRGAGTYILPRMGGAPRVLPLVAEGVTWSPDGSRLAAWRFSRPQFVVMDVADGDTSVVPIGASFTWLTDADWSPDGRRFVFATESNSKQNSIWTISASGGRPALVYSDSLSLRSPRWAPRGRAIYCLRRQGSISDLFRIPLSRSGSALGGTPTTLIPGRNMGELVSFSRSGSRMVYSEEKTRANLWRFDRRSEADSHFVLTQLTRGTYEDADPSISPDGSSIAFARTLGAMSEIYVMPIGGGVERQITFLGAACGQPVWSPSGAEIAFNSSAKGGYRVWIVPAEGGTPRRLGTSLSSPDQFTIAWAPGSKIVFPRPGNSQYVLLDPATGAESALEQQPRPGWAFSPRYSPGGMDIAMARSERSGNGIWRVPLSTRVAVPVIANVDVLLAGWSGDGSWIYSWAFEPSPVHLWAVAVSGAKQRVDGLIDVPGAVAGIDIEPNGKRGVCVALETRSDLWVVDGFDPNIK